MTEFTKRLRAGGGKDTGAEARPAATVAVLRDGETGIEALMVRRSTKLDFHGGSWVFPGGRIDADDWEGSDDPLAAARRAATRETQEEAALELPGDSLVHFSNWTTPKISPKRFATWFFVAPAPVEHGHAQADGVESDALRWFTPEIAFAERSTGAIEIAPPQYLSLLSFARFDTVSDALTVLGAEDPVHYEPNFHFPDSGGAIAVYAGDVAYEDLDKLREPGPRHRLIMSKAGWIYETV